MRESGIGRAGIVAEGERIILTPTRRRHVLAELLEGATPEAMREAFNWGPERRDR